MTNYLLTILYMHAFSSECCKTPYTAVKNLTDVFYLCIIMMAYGSSFVKATIHGIVLNTVQSLASVPEVMANGMCVTLTVIKW